MRRVGFQRDGSPTAVMDSREAAAYLAVSTYTLRRMVRRGELPHTRVGRALRFRFTDLDAYLEERTSREYKPLRRASGDSSS